MISPKVMVELHEAKLVPTQFTVTKPGEHAWSSAEQRRFWEAIHRFPQGPWTAIAAYVGSKSTRQAMTHAQKLRQKLNRWKRRVRNDPNGGDACSGGSSPRSDSIDNENDQDEGDDDTADDAFQSYMKSEVGYAISGQLEYTPLKTAQSAAVSTLSPADVSGGDHDEYLDHLLSDIEPMLENVVNFSSPSRTAYAPSAGTYNPNQHHSYNQSHHNSYDNNQQQPLGFPQFPHTTVFELDASAYSTSTTQQPSAPAQGFASSVDFRL